MPKTTEEDWDREQIPKSTSSRDELASRKAPGACPVCLGRLETSGRRARYKRTCMHCRATLQAELLCRFCQTNRVWRGPDGINCKGCGRAQQCSTW